MSGSRRFSEYVDDSGTPWAVDLDEDTIESADLGFSGGMTSLDLYVLPQNGRRPLRMRYVNAYRIEGVAPAAQTIRARFPVGTAAAYNAIVGSFFVGGTLWQVRSKVGERRELVPALDTEINDGDVDANLLPVP